MKYIYGNMNEHDFIDSNLFGDEIHTFSCKHVKNAEFEFFWDKKQYECENVYKKQFSSLHKISECFCFIKIFLCSGLCDKLFMKIPNKKCEKFLLNCFGKEIEKYTKFKMSIDGINFILKSNVVISDNTHNLQKNTMVDFSEELKIIFEEFKINEN